jgi:hypothetical protein
MSFAIPAPVARLSILGLIAAATPLQLPAQASRIDERVVDSVVAAGMRQQRMVGASVALAPLGEVRGAELLGVSERGGMQVARVRLTVGGKAVNTLMYRRPDGVMEQFLLW